VAGYKLPIHSSVFEHHVKLLVLKRLFKGPWTRTGYGWKGTAVRWCSGVVHGWCK